MPQFKLKSTVGSSDPVGPEDALATKTALHQLGFLDRPREGFSRYPDQAMFDGIRKFQKQKDLLDDGIMRPDGQTAEKIAKDLARQKPQGVVNDNAPSTQTASARSRKPEPSPILASGSSRKANAQSSSIPTPQNKPQMPRFPPLYASKKFREAIAQLETGGEPKNGYGTDKHLAIGRYQMQPDALVEAEFMTKRTINGVDKFSWVGREGINSKTDFLADTPEANRIQEFAFDEYIRSLERQLKGKGTHKYLGKAIKGLKANITVTLPGLVAAAHRQGPGNVNRYLKMLEKNGWDSSKYSKQPEEIRSIYTAIETRLRQFQNVSHRSPKKS